MQGVTDRDKTFSFNRTNPFTTMPDRSQVIALALVLAQFRGKIVAEGVGFEPTRACALPVFKTGAINHSTTPPVPARADGAIHYSITPVLQAK